MEYKVYSPTGECVAICRYAEDAACLAAFHGDGATVNDGRRVLWREGIDGSAAESYDAAAATMHEREG